MRLLLMLAILGVGCFERTTVPAPEDELPKKKDTPAISTTPAPKPVAKTFAPVENINAEITVLQVLHSLQCSPAQLEAFARAASSTVQDTPARKEIKVTAEYRRAIQGYRDALARGDTKEIDKRFEILQRVKEQEDPEFDVIEVTAASRKEAGAMLKRLGARQVADYLAGIEEFPDPVELVAAAVEESRKLRGEPWRDLRDSIAYQAGWLIGGMDVKAETSVRQKVVDLLDKSARLEDKAFTEQQAAILKEAQGLVGALGPTDMMRHYMERVLAEVLSNHRLKMAVQRMQKAQK